MRPLGGSFFLLHKRYHRAQPSTKEIDGHVVAELM